MLVAVAFEKKKSKKLKMNAIIIVSRYTNELKCHNILVTNLCYKLYHCKLGLITIEIVHHNWVITIKKWQ